MAITLNYRQNNRGNTRTSKLRREERFKDGLFGDLMDTINVPQSLLIGAIKGETPGESLKYRQSFGDITGDTTAGKIAGFGLDVVADPLNLVGAGLIAKGIKGAGAAAKATKGLDIASDIDSPVAKVIKAAKESKPLRKGLEAERTVERGKRVKKAQEAFEQTGRGEKGFRAELSKMKGELADTPDVESLRPKLNQGDVDNLVNQIDKTPQLDFWDSLNAKKSLVKVLDGNLPTKGEREILEKAFGREFADAVSQKTWKETAKKYVKEAVNLPRTMMASMDMSAPLRQGLVLFASQPAKGMKAFGQMFKYFGDKKAIKELDEIIANKDTFELMRKTGVSFTRWEGGKLSSKEEIFMSNFAERIPGLGHLIKASERAYVGFLNKFRADTYDDLAKKFMKGGITPEKDPKAFQDLANFVNNATGRGSLGAAGKYAEELNTLFFSPKLIASRVNLLNPVKYAKMSKPVRKEALKSMLSLGVAGVTALSLAKMNGAEVETDPRSSDFGKMKVGKTRIDPWGGFQQYMRLTAQLMSGQRKSIKTGEISEMGEGYGAPTRLSTTAYFGRGKLSPVTGMLVDMFEGKDMLGRETTLSRQAAQRFVPIYLQDLTEAWSEVGEESIGTTAIPGFFGVGTNIYTDLGGNNKKRARLHFK